MASTLTSPSAFLTVARAAALFGGAVYGGVKLGQIQTEQNKIDLALLAEFDLAESLKPAAERSPFARAVDPALLEKKSAASHGHHH